MIGSILVALDDSLRAPGVLEAAAEIARNFDAELVPVRVIFVPQEFPPSGHVAHSDPLPEHMAQEARARLRELTAALTDVKLLAPIVRHGEPWRAILNVAVELDVDLIVLGSHGYRGLDRLLGTTAGKVASHADRNVLVVHNRTRPGAALGTASGRD